MIRMRYAETQPLKHSRVVLRCLGATAEAYFSRRPELAHFISSISPNGHFMEQVTALGGRWRSCWPSTLTAA